MLGEVTGLDNMEAPLMPKQFTTIHTFIDLVTQRRRTLRDGEEAKTGTFILPSGNPRKMLLFILTGNTNVQLYRSSKSSKGNLLCVI